MDERKRDYGWRMEDLNGWIGEHWIDGQGKCIVTSLIYGWMIEDDGMDEWMEEIWTDRYMKDGREEGSIDGWDGMDGKMEGDVCMYRCTMDGWMNEI